MRAPTSAILGFAGTLLVVVCAVALVGRVNPLGDRSPGLRLVDASGAAQIANDREGQAIVTADGLTPGRAVHGRVTVSSGSSALTLSEAQPVDHPGPGGGRLSDRLTLEVADLTDEAHPRVLFSGSLRGLPRVDLGPAPGGGNRVYRFTVSWPDSATPGADNAFMAASTSVAFDWDAAATEPAADAPYADQVAYDAPSAHWSLGPAANDTAGGHDGDFFNGVTPGVTGVLGTGTAARFDGDSGYVAVNGFAAPASTYTLEAWIRPDRTGDMTIVEQGGAGSLLLRGGRPVFRQVDTEVVAADAVSTGAWHHIAGTWDGRTARLYVDGVAQASAIATKRPSGSATVYVGYGQNAPWFAGSIDQVAYYASALPAGRIAAHHDAVGVIAAAEPADSAAAPAPAPVATGPAPAPVVVASQPATHATAAADAKARAKAKARARARAKAKARARAKAKALARKRAAAKRKRQHHRP